MYSNFPHISQNAHGVSACVECETGVLTLDQASQPKWKLVCNKCDVIVRLFEDAQKVSDFRHLFFDFFI